MDKPIFHKLFNHDMQVEFSDNGGVFVTAGCCKLTFSNIEEFIDKLIYALAHPEEFEKAYFDYIKEKPVLPGAPDPALGCGR